MHFSSLYSETMLFKIDSSKLFLKLRHVPGQCCFNAHWVQAINKGPLSLLISHSKSVLGTCYAATFSCVDVSTNPQ